MYPIYDSGHRISAKKKFGKAPYHMGVELEVENKRGVWNFSRYCYDDDIEDNAHKVVELLGGPEFAICKDDYSLSNGFEIVTAPASLEFHKEKWDKFFNERPPKIVARKSCGLHVHVSRKPLSKLTIGKLLVFVNLPENRGFVQKIARRTTSEYSRYIKKKISDAKSNNYNRYEAINICNRNTIEFRIFKSTLKKNEFFSSLEFVDSLIQFCMMRHTTVKKLVKNEYTEYLMAKEYFYPNLIGFLREKALVA